MRPSDTIIGTEPHRPSYFSNVFFIAFTACGVIGVESSRLIAQSGPSPGGLSGADLPAGRGSSGGYVQKGDAE